MNQGSLAAQAALSGAGEYQHRVLNEKHEKRLSLKVQALLNELNEYEKRAIRHDHVFKKDRNDLLCKLVGRGARVEILAEASGLSRAQIYRIIAKTQSPDPLVKGLQDLTDTIGRLTRAVLTFREGGAD